MARSNKNGTTLDGVCEKCGKHFSYASNGGPAQRFCSKKCSQAKWYSDKQGKPDIKSQTKLVNRLYSEVFKSSKKDDDLLKDIAKNSGGLSKAEHCAMKVSLLKTHNANRMSEARKSDKYAEYLSEKRKLASMCVVERKRKQREKTRLKERNKLKHQLQRARKKGLKIEYKKCPVCGSVFGYVAEQLTKNGVIPIPERNIPRFCTNSCYGRNAWLTRKKKVYEENRLKKSNPELETQEEKKEILRSTWRGSGNFYTIRNSGSKYTTYSSFKKIDELVSCLDD